MDSNGSYGPYSFDENSLPQSPVTDFFGSGDTEPFTANNTTSNTSFPFDQNFAAQGSGMEFSGYSLGAYNANLTASNTNYQSFDRSDLPLDPFTNISGNSHHTGVGAFGVLAAASSSTFYSTDRDTLRQPAFPLDQAGFSCPAWNPDFVASFQSFPNSNPFDHSDRTPDVAPKALTPQEMHAAASSNQDCLDMETLFHLPQSDVRNLRRQFFVGELTALNNLPMHVDASTPPPVLCDWPSCPPLEVFPNLIARSHHVTDVHVAAVLDNWPGPCTWPGCPSKANFQSKNLLRTHVNNVHTDPLHCTQAGCKNGRPFAKQGDLDRHLASIHKIGKAFPCPRKDCPRSKRVFYRKDKLAAHVDALGHGQIECPHDHCPLIVQQFRFFSKKSLAKHIEDSSLHGPYECAIGECIGSSSGFSINKLVVHLRVDHLLFATRDGFTANIPQDGVITEAIINNMEAAGVVISYHYDYRKSFYCLSS